ncbi:MAG: Gfo/Idh/MocA family oxidoreductase, partial [Verrucomicrobiota bacterium]
MSTKVGIIGAGGMAQYHIAGFRQAGAEILAVADLNAEAAKASAEANSIPNSYGKVEDMFEAHPDMDAVTVIVPNKFHAPIAIQCLNAGKHVFCEKPPAINAAEMQEMLEASEKAGKKLMFNFNNRARPESYAMKAYAEDGTLGKINSAQAKWARRTGIPGFGGWFTNKDLAGGGP